MAAEGDLQTLRTLPADVELQCSLQESVDEDGRSVCRASQSSYATAWAAEFKPRPANEHARNCSRVDRSVKAHIVETLTGLLLETENWIEIDAGKKWVL